MRKSIFMIVLMAMFAPLAMKADNLQVQVGEGTTQNYDTPINLYYNYSYVQMVYTADQLSGTCGADINSISFYYVGTVEKTAPITVFMKNTTRTSFSSTTDFEAVTASDIVFEGDWTVSTTNGWYTITLDTPFAYDGTNLLIAINKGYYTQYSNSTKFNHTATTNNQVLHARQDSGAYDPYTISTGYGVSTALPNILFNMTLAHPAPTNVRVSDISGNSANIVWDAPATNGVSYAYEYTDGSTIQNGTTSSTSVNLTSLDPETSYLFEVKAVYADGESCAMSIEFETLEACPTPRNLTVDELSSNGATISWTGSGPDSYTVQTASVGSTTTTETILSEGFEGGSMPAGWTTTGSYWNVTSGTGYNGYTGAATGSYNAGCYIGSYTGTDILITPAMDLGTASSARLSFNFWNTSWGGDINVLNVYYRVNEGDWNLLESYDEETTSWENVRITLEGLAAGYQIGFECEAHYSYGMGIDDVEITAEVAGLSWTDYDTNASNPYTFVNPLDPETTYRVRVIGVCGGVPGDPSDVLTFTTPSCASVPTNLAEANITTSSAHLSWTGTSDSYMVKYSPWYATGDDVLPTGSMQTYTFDLSQYSGQGSVVIRHYDVTNMFRLIVDDIVVKNAAGTVVYSQDFESCGGVMPSEFSNMDMDGDGYVWEIVDNSQSYVNGTYGLSSASWTSATDALWPDNWLVLSGIDLGGSISFQARGQDASFAAENFNVYVCPDNEIVEKPAATNSYDITGLPPYTPVAWQVKGICGEDESTYASSFFTTLDDVLIFTEEGNWDDLGNWTDVTGNAISALPAITNKVRIDYDVTIPAGVVAYAKKIKLNGGTVTIADGGQLKQESTSEVIIKKHINGYGDSNNNWYFIASPLTTTRLTYMDGWSYVNALTGEYDLYAFDATASGLEWINFKSSSTNAAFTSGSNNPVLVSHKGYLYANSEDMDLEFEGATAEPSYNKVLTDDFTYEEGAAYNWNGWALVGNPFTCNAYISYVDADGLALEADFYTLNTDNTYSLMSSSDALAPCTGAFINYAATGKIQYSTEAPAKGMGLLNMTLSQNRGRIDQARIRFGEGFNLGKMNFRDSSKLYIQQDNVDYGVVYTDNSGEMPVSFKAEANGTYTISFNAENVSFNYLRLIDNLTGTEVDLLANPSYTFSASTSDYACRFKLVFGVNTGVGEITDAPFAFISNGNLLVNGEGTLQMVDMMGRVLSTEQINGSYSKSLNLSAGVYVLRLTNGNDVKTQKIVVE